jgi:hypothetical protein
LKPPHCVVCGDERHGATLVQFADYRALPDGMPGHPHGLDWFCERHAPAATELRHLPIADAVARIRRRRGWWPFG